MKIFIMVIVIFYYSLLMAKQVSVKVISDPWPPWQIGNEGEAPTGGKSIVIAKEIFKRANVKAEFRLYPWKRCLAYMKTGKADIVMILSKTKSRMEFMVYSEPFITDKYLLYYRKGDNIKWNKWQDLKNYKIGIVSEFNYGDEFRSAAKKYIYNIVESHNDVSSIKNLLIGRLDCVILNRTIAKDLFKKHLEYRKKISIAKKPIKINNYHMAFSKKSKKLFLKNKINKIIKQLKAEGFIKKVLE